VKGYCNRLKNDHEILLGEVERLNEGISMEKKNPLNEIQNIYNEKQEYNNFASNQSDKILQENFQEYVESDEKVLPSPEFAFHRKIEFT